MEGLRGWLGGGGQCGKVTLPHFPHITTTHNTQWALGSGPSWRGSIIGMENKRDGGVEGTVGGWAVR
jgi:hypothetical protein